MPHALHCRMFRLENERKMRTMNKMTVAAVALAALTTFPSVLKADGIQKAETAALERWIAEQDKSVGGQPSEIPEATERR